MASFYAEWSLRSSWLVENCTTQFWCIAPVFTFFLFLQRRVNFQQRCFSTSPDPSSISVERVACCDRVSRRIKTITNFASPPLFCVWKVWRDFQPSRPQVVRRPDFWVSLEAHRQVSRFFRYQIRPPLASPSQISSTFELWPCSKTSALFLCQICPYTG